MLTCLRRAALALAAVLLPVIASAQGVLQSANVTPGHLAIWTAPGVIQDGGTSANGSLTTLGITSPNLCSLGINSGPITSSYVELCIGTNALGQAQISVTPYGSSALSTPLNFVDPAGILINGQQLGNSLCQQFGSLSGQCANGGNQMANVLDFGAVGDGVTDDTAAILAALASTRSGAFRSVYLPAPKVKYYITNALTLNSGQCLVGDGKDATQLYVTQTFNASAAGVVIINPPTQPLNVASAPSPCVHDLTVFFQQPQDQSFRSNFTTLGTCTSALGGTGCKYPPAIYYNQPLGQQTGARFIIRDMRIAGAWKCISINGNAISTGGPFLHDLELGCLDTDIFVQSLLDEVHIARVHSWPFGIGDATSLNLYNFVYSDWNHVALNLATGPAGSGNVVEDFFSLNGKVILAANTVNMQMTDLNIDGGPPNAITVSGGSGVHISNSHATAGAGSATASVSGTVMTVTGTPTAMLAVGMALQGTGVTPGTTVTSFGTGVGNAGTYNISNNLGTLSSRTINFSGDCVFTQSSSGSESWLSNNDFNDNYGRVVCHTQGTVTATGGTITSNARQAGALISQTGSASFGQYTGVWLQESPIGGALTGASVEIDAGTIAATGNHFNAGVAGVAFNVQTDDPHNIVANNDIGDMKVTSQAATVPLGIYWPNSGAYYGSAAGVSGCGSPGCTISGNNWRGSVTIGTGGAGATITFANPFTTENECPVVNYSGGSTNPTVAKTLSSLVLTGLSAGQIVQWNCTGD